MGIRLIIEEIETSVIHGIHKGEDFIEHLAEKIAVALGIEKASATEAVTQAVNSLPSGNVPSKSPNADAISSAQAVDTVAGASS